MKEFQDKVEGIRKHLSIKNIYGISISLQQNFAWLTCGGRNYVGTHTEKGIATIYVDALNVILITNNIEANRIISEELGNCGEVTKLQEHQTNQIQLIEYDWYGPALSTKALLFKNKVIKSEQVNIESDEDPIASAILSTLRCKLNKFEIDRYKLLGRDCGALIAKVAKHHIRRGVSESELTSKVAEECYKLNIVPVVILIASDERVDNFRHPIPHFSKCVQNKVMLVLCGRRYGLIASVTRMVHIGPIPSELRAKHDAVCYVDAVAMSMTKVGNNGSKIFERIKHAYEEKNFGGEWKLHHQGGQTGYMSREWKACDGDSHQILAESAFAWNPSITGTKSEDTIVINGDGECEIITESEEWPTLNVTVDNCVYKRADILQVVE
ncbi:hypothetical protein AKO1_003266 [Acrasis kona]|uniref:Peptidase M24 domain-containing protein n=1 Tax=Acrasis kona TaxID=1008807 RepID=A0AAW2ZAB8_9EUKA